MATQTARLLKRLRNDFQLSIITLMGLFGVIGISPYAIYRLLQGNYLVGIFKDTPMLSVIGVTELMQAANSIGSETYRFLEPYTLVGVIFLALSLPTAGLVRLGERRLRRKLGL